MKKIVISIFILSISLHGAIFEHSTDLKEKYKFDPEKQSENEQLAAELDKFINNSISEEEIQKYIKLRDEDNQTKVFAKDIYIDSGILKQRGIEPSTAKTDEKSCGWIYEIPGCSSGYCSWIFSIFACDEGSKNVDMNSSETEALESVAEEKGIEK